MFSFNPYNPVKANDYPNLLPSNLTAVTVTWQHVFVYSHCFSYLPYSQMSTPLPNFLIHLPILWSSSRIRKLCGQWISRTENVCLQRTCTAQTLFLCPPYTYRSSSPPHQLHQYLLFWVMMCQHPWTAKNVPLNVESGGDGLFRGRRV